MKKTVIGIIVVVVIVLLALWMRSGSGSQVATEDTSFENEAAAVLSAPISAQAKVDQLNANLQARLAARKARNAKVGATAK